MFKLRLRRFAPNLICALLLLALMSQAIPPAYAAPPPSDIPAEARLTGLRMLWQQYNRCAATALYIQLSYYGWEGSATDIVRWLNPYAEDMSVRLEEMQAFAESEGFKGIARTGGTIELMQRLVAGGFPVLVENAYWHRNDNNDWMSHNRVLMGYDGGAFYFYDPLLGPGDDGNGYAIRYEEFDNRWHDFNRDYLIIYQPEDESRLQAILGDNWDTAKNAEWTFFQSESEFAARGDAFSLYNMGEALLVLGLAEEAATKFDEARALGLPWRMHWYRFGALEAYLQVGRYDDVINLVYEVHNQTTQVQEVYYYIAGAYAGLGNFDRARSNYLAALDRNANYPEAQTALDALNAQAGE